MLPSAIRMLDVVEDRSQYLGRAAICHHVLRLHPTDPEVPDALVERARAGVQTWLDLREEFSLDALDRQGGYAWAVVAPNQLTLGLSAKAFPTEAAARADAAALLARAEELQTVRVADEVTHHNAVWLTLDDEVVLVSARLWRRPDASTENALWRALRRQGVDTV
ncbi:hypothetical protein GCM10025789_29470 [Tessaracoccus lubricantis]|uniref:Uncharacterized protein n=1 Tax=Tessaracoccus lubricantis TaxID=545543 RepID=A0ABP9FMI3_9ACTN